MSNGKRACVDWSTQDEKAKAFADTEKIIFQRKAVSVKRIP